jgi:hypothetical protein
MRSCPARLVCSSRQRDLSLWFGLVYNSPDRQTGLSADALISVEDRVHATGLISRKVRATHRRECKIDEGRWR